MDRFEWIRRELREAEDEGSGRELFKVYSLVIHPDTSGMAHIVGMLERFLLWLKEFGDEVEFRTLESIAEEWRSGQGSLPK